MSKRILFFGNERLATGVTTTAPALRSLIENGYDVAAVVVAQAEPGQSRAPRELEVAQIASEHDIPLLTPVDLKVSLEDLKEYEAAIGVLAAYGKLVPPELIDIFPRGIVNIHPSLLPKHRGSIPIEAVILNGETATGVSLMKLVTELDAGPIYAQTKVDLSGQETKQELTDRLSALAANLLIEHLSGILDGSLEPHPQAGEPTVDERINKSASVIDWQKPAIQLEREIRAYAGWPRSRTKLGQYDVIVTQAHIAEGQAVPGEIHGENRQLSVGTSNGLLIIDRLIPPGKSEMPIAAFLAGYKIN